MIKRILPLAIFLLAGLVAYNYFLGTDEEKKQATEIIGGVKSTAKTIGSLLKSEKNKFDNGKYDEAMKSMGNLFNQIKDKVSGNNQLQQSLEELEVKKDDLEEKMSEAKTDEEKKRYKNDFKEIIEGAEAILERLKKEKE